LLSLFADAWSVKTSTFSTFEPEELDEPEEQAEASPPTPATAAEATPALSTPRRLNGSLKIPEDMRVPSLCFKY
jgi:hypothetical protein